MQVQSLYYYPVKSLPGINVERLELDDFGPVGDRRWMITDQFGQFITQRNYPALARVGISVDAGVVSIEVPDQGRFRLIASAEAHNVMVWNDWIEAERAEAGPAEGLSNYLGIKVDVVYMPDRTFRIVDRVWVKERRRVGFADGFPFLIVNQASLDELNTRLEDSIDIRRFRPNIVVTGAEPWAEDHWGVLLIGSVRFSLVKPCSRCVLTTVDPDTGTKAADQQPLRTLGSYRRQPGGVIFGMNAIHGGEGPVVLGDAVSFDEFGEKQ
ncbi:MAG: MOSC N-terminal beta barrel domain-containing protein [Marinobacter sp.]|uniref:MOSC domain-containing protein n=1 Tax=Marinobacter sp. TaxID=50741 RepID=UPI0034A08172